MKQACLSHYWRASLLLVCSWSTRGMPIMPAVVHDIVLVQNHAYASAHDNVIVSMTMSFYDNVIVSMLVVVSVSRVMMRSGMNSEQIL